MLGLKLYIYIYLYIFLLLIEHNGDVSPEKKVCDSRMKHNIFNWKKVKGSDLTEHVLSVYSNKCTFHIFKCIVLKCLMLSGDLFARVWSLIRSYWMLLFVDAEPQERKEKTKKNQEGVSNLDFLPTFPPPFKSPHPYTCCIIKLNEEWYFVCLKCWNAPQVAIRDVIKFCVV